MKGKDSKKKSGGGIIHGTIPEFAWMDHGKPRRSPARIVGVLA
jgi:hypothetical protein